MGLYYAAYGLGSPFPEDAKLCAALNSFWPAVAPDASRTFHMGLKSTFASPTAIPLMDNELGYHPDHPLVQAGKVQSKPGWEGEYGPFFERLRGKEYVNSASLDRSDYVSNSLRNAFDIRLISWIDATELIRRMQALRSCIAALPPANDRVSDTNLWLVTAESVADWATEVSRANAALVGPGFHYVFVLISETEELVKDVRRRRTRRKEIRLRDLRHDALLARGPGRVAACVVIVGGGPAGAAAAIAARSYTLRVVVLERDATARMRPGEAAHPGIEPLLTRLGVMDAVWKAGFLCYEGHWVARGAEPLHFVPFGRDERGSWKGFQLWRPDFDAILLNGASKAGAMIVRPCGELHPIVRGNRVVGVSLLSNDELIFAARIDEQPAVDLFRRNSIIEQDRCYTPLDFLHWIFEVPIPDYQRLAGCLSSEQVTPEHYSDCFYELEAGFPKSTWRDCRRGELADVVAGVQPLPRGMVRGSRQT